METATHVRVHSHEFKVVSVNDDFWGEANFALHYLLHKRPARTEGRLVSQSITSTSDICSKWKGIFIQPIINLQNTGLVYFYLNTQVKMKTGYKLVM